MYPLDTIQMLLHLLDDPSTAVLFLFNRDKIVDK